MDVGAWLELNAAIGDLMGGLGTIGQSSTESHDCMKRKNMCHVIERKARHSLEVKDMDWFTTLR